MDIKRARVVLVEDEKVMSAFVLGQLRRLGILDLFAFEDGEVAIHQIAKLKPDLIITDVHMQPVGGIEFVRELRSAEDTHINRIPVIFLSADSSSETIGQVLPLGVSGYIVKPPTLSALDKKITNALAD
jgi:two-component system, chemotaxis family, chemotaxis protein CheY